MIIKRSADLALLQISKDAPEAYDTFVEIAEELTALKNKLDLISVSNEINLDNIPTQLMGTIDDFETALVLESSQLPEGSLSNGNIGTIEDFENSLIN